MRELSEMITVTVMISKKPALLALAGTALAATIARPRRSRHGPGSGPDAGAATAPIVVHVVAAENFWGNITEPAGRTRRQR